MVAEPTSDPIATIDQFITAFIQAWPTGDAAELARFFSNDAIFHNGSLPAVHGRDAIVASFAQQMTLGGQVSVDIRHMLADGPIVMNERIDYLTLDNKTVPLRIMGIFEVHDGVITAWRDYFDPSEFSSQL